MFLKTVQNGGGIDGDIVIDFNQPCKSPESVTFTYDPNKTYYVSAGFVGALGAGSSGYFSSVTIKNNQVTPIGTYQYITISVDTSSHVITFSGTYSSHYWQALVLHAE